MFYTPKLSFNLNCARIIIFGALLYKLLSRDFGFFGYVPEAVFSFYPIYIYNPLNFIISTGVKPLLDIATFHWIHWILPLPTPFVLRSVQFCTVLFCILALFFGRGPRGLYAIGSYIGMIYLWGFIMRAGMDIDAMYLIMGCMFVYLFSDHEEKPIHQINHLLLKPKDSSSGWLYSGFLCIFVIYYFTSGINKISDITLPEWFQFDLVQMYLYSRDKAVAGFGWHIPEFFRYLEGNDWISYVGPPLVYFCHLTAPLMFFYRSHLLKFFLFYAAFHFLSISVGIVFFANFLLWLIFIPFGELSQKMIKYLKFQ